jgi:hypothetical protein
MLQSEQVEELIDLVASLDRPALIQQFHTFRASFPIDFTLEFLSAQPLDRLRHLFLALCLQQQRLPQLRTPEAA